MTSCLIVNTDYPGFLQDFYTQRPELRDASYAEQLAARAESLFGVADFYSSNLRRLGYEVRDVHANNPYLQRAWASENGSTTSTASTWSFRLRRGFVPWLSRTPDRWLANILVEQIEQFRPDVLLNEDMTLDPKIFRRARRHVGFLVGEHAASPLRSDMDWSVYDLATSSFPPTLEWFRARGLPAELQRLGFEPAILHRVTAAGRDYPVTFVGSFYRIHRSRTALLEHLAGTVPLRVWGNSPPDGFRASPLADRYMGPAWGEDMYRVLSRSKIVVNHHGDVAPHANNMRMYEATGMGALLVTDAKVDLSDVFEPESEVVTYSSPEECAEKIRYYLEHETERQQIAEAGQRRTLSEHTYFHRMQQLDCTLRKHAAGIRAPHHIEHERSLQDS